MANLLDDETFETLKRLGRIETCIAGFTYVHKNRTPEPFESLRLQILLKTFHSVSVPFLADFIPRYQQSRPMSRGMQRCIDRSMLVNSIETFRRADERPLEVVLRAEGGLISNVCEWFEDGLYFTDRELSLPNDLLNLICSCIKITKFVETCLPRDVVNDPGVDILPDLSEAYFRTMYEYCYMFGDLEKFRVINLLEE
jgi:hypothetical protein